MMSVSVFRLGVAKPQRFDGLPEFEQVVLTNIGQYNVLFMRCAAQLGKAEAIRQGSANASQLGIGHIAGARPALSPSV